jgi:hypothetical protein
MVGWLFVCLVGWLVDGCLVVQFRCLAVSPCLLLGWLIQSWPVNQKDQRVHMYHLSKGFGLLEGGLEIQN